MAVRVLIVEDSRTIRSFIRRAVEALHAEVVGEAENGRDGLQSFMELRPDVTLLDINMPFMNGKDVLKRIKKEDPGACVVMLTTQNSANVVQECIQEGLSNYILKDISMDELIEELRGTIDGFNLKK